MDTDNNKKTKVRVLVSVTYSRPFEVIVNEGYSDADLKKAVLSRKTLPNDVLEDYHRDLQDFIDSNDWLSKGTPFNELLSEEMRLRPWHEDELEVIEEWKTSSENTHGVLNM